MNNSLLGLYNWNAQPLQPGVYTWEQYKQVNGDSQKPKKMGNFGTTLVDNGGEILGGLGSLINAINGKQPVTNVYMPASEETQAKDNTIYWVLGVIAFLAVLYFVFKA